MKVLVDHVLGREPVSGGLARLTAVLPGAGRPGGMLAWVAFSGLAFFSLNSLFDFLLTCTWVRVGQRMVYDLARDLFAQIQRRSLRFHSQNSVGDSMSRITGDSWCINGLVDTLVVTPARALILLVAITVVMVRMDWRLTLVSVVAAPLMTVSALLLGKKVRSAAHARREVESKIQSHVQQTLSGIQVVQAFAQETSESRRFRELAAAAVRASQRGVLLSNFSSLATGLVTTAASGIVLCVAAWHVLDGKLSVGGMLVFVTYLWSMHAQMKVVVGTYTTLQGAGAQVDRVMEVLESEAEVRELAGAVGLGGSVRGEVAFEEVVFGYEPGRAVLRGVSLVARPGEVVAVVGPTGAGKSTLAALVPRLFDPWGGRVTLDGRDVRGLRLSELRERVALVLQEPFLFPVSVAANIAYGRPSATRAEVEAAARAANAHEFVAGLPRGYDTVVGERGATLSGGQRQRLAIARALLKDAPVLVMDEPTSALDGATERLLMGAVGRLMAGRTTFVIAHRLSTIRGADQILVLDGGRVVERGRHAELAAIEGGLYRRLWGAMTATTAEEECRQ
jgi:ATP-binding cassette subfamily B protein/subfamily B ATP-binding cassette protein MsbA